MEYLDRQFEIKTRSTRSRNSEPDWEFLTRECMPGIVLAGAAYPACCLFFWFLFHLATEALGGRFDTTEVLFALGALVVSAFVGGLFCAILSAMAGVVSIWLIWIFNRMFGSPVSIRTCGICAGSLTGYILTAWVISQHSVPLGYYLLNVIAGPILAMVMGSLGVHFYARPRRLMPSSPPKRLQLSIRHLMAATACFAVAFCVAKVLNGTEFVWLFALWLLIQGALLAIAHAFHYCRSEKNVLKEGRSR